MCEWALVNRGPFLTAEFRLIFIITLILVWVIIVMATMIIPVLKKMLNEESLSL